MFQRIFAIVAATFLLAACETASQVSGDSASTSASNTASSSALHHHLRQQKKHQLKSLRRLVTQ